MYRCYIPNAMDEEFVEALNQQLEQSPISPVAAKKLWVNVRMSLRTTKFTRIIVLNARYCFAKPQEPIPSGIANLLSFLEGWPGIRSKEVDWGALLRTLRVIVLEAELDTDSADR